MITYGYFYQLLIVVAFAIVIIKMITKRKNKIKIFTACILMVYTVEAVGIFFFPIYYNQQFRKLSPPDINLIPLYSITQYSQHFSVGTAVREILGNVFIFIPVGLLLPMIFEKLRPIKNILICSFLMSLGIETIQLMESLLTHIPNHVVDIDDVILNFIGGIIGYLIFNVLQAVWKAIAKRKQQINS